MVENHRSWVKLVMPIEGPSIKMPVINSMMPVNMGKFCIPLNEGAITESYRQHSCGVERMLLKSNKGENVGCPVQFTFLFNFCEIHIY